MPSVTETKNNDGQDHSPHSSYSLSPNKYSPTQEKPQPNVDFTDISLNLESKFDNIELSNLAKVVPLSAEHTITIYNPENITRKSIKLDTLHARQDYAEKSDNCDKHILNWLPFIKSAMLSLLTLTSISIAIYFATREQDEFESKMPYATLLSLFAGITLQANITVFASSKLKNMSTRFGDYLLEEAAFFSAFLDIFLALNHGNGQDRLSSTYVAMRTGMMFTEVLEKTLLKPKNQKIKVKVSDCETLPVSWAAGSKKNNYIIQHQLASDFCKDLISQHSLSNNFLPLRKFAPFYAALTAIGISLTVIGRAGADLPGNFGWNAPAILLSHLGLIMIGGTIGSASFNYIPRNKTIQNILAFSISLLISPNGNWYNWIISSLLGLTVGYNFSKTYSSLETRRYMVKSQTHLINQLFTTLFEKNPLEKLGFDKSYEYFYKRKFNLKQRIYLRVLQLLALVSPLLIAFAWDRKNTLPTYSAFCYLFLLTHWIGATQRLNPVKDAMGQGIVNFANKMKLLVNYFIEENLLPLEIIMVFASKWRYLIKSTYTNKSDAFLYTFNPVFYGLFGVITGLKKSERQYLQFLDKEKLIEIENILQSSSPFKRITLTKAELNYLYYCVNKTVEVENINNRKLNNHSIQPSKETQKILALDRRSLNPNITFFKVEKNNSAQCEKLKEKKLNSLIRGTLFVPPVTNCLTLRP